MIANSVGEGAVYGSGRLLDDLVEYVYSGEHCRFDFVGRYRTAASGGSGA